MVKFLKTLHAVFNVKKLIFQIKILNEINFFLKINYILIQCKMLLFLLNNFYGPLTFRMVYYWSIEHNSVGLKRSTIQIVFNEACSVS